MKPTTDLPEADLLQIMAMDVGDIDQELDGLLERGKKERVQILDGTELPGRKDQPIARTHVTITFHNEDNLRECVKLLRWSDERLRMHPDQLLLWEWNMSFREGMTISFGVNWYSRDFFDRRKDAFKEPRHAAFYARFGAGADDFDIRHEVLT